MALKMGELGVQRAVPAHVVRFRLQMVFARASYRDCVAEVPQPARVPRTAM